MCMKVYVLEIVMKEMKNESGVLKQNIFGVLDKLEQGEKIPMPICRPLFSVMKGLFELRFSDQAGEYRVFYYVKVKGAIYVIHAMRKKTRKIDVKTLRLLKNRIRGLL